MAKTSDDDEIPHSLFEDAVSRYFKDDEFASEVERVVEYLTNVGLLIPDHDDPRVFAYRAVATALHIWDTEA